MKRSPFLILLLILSSCTSSNDSLPGEAGSALLVAEPWYEDFESGTVSSWFSYPPFQDTAFDFTLIPGWHRPASHLRGYTDSGNYNYPLDLAPPEDGGTYYLLRAHRPNSGGPQKIGLAYKKALLTGSRSTTLSFDYWLQYPVDASGVLRVELSGSDGRRYSETIPNPEPAVWQNAELQLSDFESEDGISLDGTTEINAVAIYLDLDKGDPSSFVFVALDNVKADAYQQAGFELATPETHQMTHWPIEFGKQHFHPGDELQIDTRANLPLVNVEATLLSLFDEPLAEPLTLTREGENRWQYDGGFTLPEEALGPITLRLEGRDQYGQIARTDVRLWNTEPAEADRPRVLFSDSSRQEIRDKIASSTRFSTIWNRITRRAEASRENPFPEQVNFTDLPNEYLFNSIGKWSEHMGRSRVEEIFDNALVWHIDRDPDARQFAIDSMLRMAGWEQWIHPWFTHQGRAAYYPIGHAVKSIGLAYDLLYDELTSEQRAAVRQGVMKNGIIPIWNEYASDNRIPNNTSNWISMAAGGTLVGLMAFHDELHLDGWERDGEPWFSPLAEKMFELSKQTMLSEGSYGEGIGYQHITYSHAQSFMAALDHQFGVRGLAETLNYTKGHLFWLYISLDRTQDALAMGDSNPRRGALDYWSWFARESDNELLKWFYAQRPGAGWMALLWDEEDAHEQGTPPEEVLPNSMVFPEKGNVVFRTGWDESDAVFVYRSGPFFNHTHFEQGHFRFYAAGEELVTEPGRASYYSDPYFWSYFIQPAAHNTILVDDFPESQFAGDYKNEMTGFNKYARLKDALVSDAGGFLVSELAPVYHSDLETMQRRIWFIDPGYVVIDDRVRSNGEAHTYQMQLHPPNLPSLAIDGDRARVTGEQSTLDIQVLMPDAPRLIKKQYPLANRDIDVENLLPKGALQVTHDSPQRNQEFRVVLTPRRDGMDFPSSIREVEGDNFKAIEASFSDGRRDRIYFRTGDDISDQIETDAQTAFISLNAEGKVRAAGFEGATHFQIGDRFSFSSEYPGHGMFHLHEDGERIRLSRGLLDTGSVPASVTTQSVGEVRENLSSPESGNGLIERTQGAEQTRLDVNLSGEPLEIDILYNE